MASSAIDNSLADERRVLNVSHLLVPGAVTAAVVFVICSIGTFIPFSSPTHAYISLFTSADVNSGRALGEGLVWSLLFGGLPAGLFALTYNATATLARRYAHRQVMCCCYRRGRASHRWAGWPEWLRAWYKKAPPKRG